MPLRFGAIKRTVAPTTEPVTLAQAKAQLRVLHSEEDEYITGLIKTAREWAEDYTRMAFLAQTLVAQYPDWPNQFTPNFALLDSTFILARPPLVAVESVQYYDVTDTLITLDPSTYNVDTIQSPGTVRLKQTTFSNSPWGVPLSKNYVNPITITYTAGYGDDASDVPSKIQQAMLIMIAHWYEQRTPIVIDVRIVMVQVPQSATDLLDSIKIRMV